MNPLLYLGLMLLNITSNNFDECLQAFGDCNNITYYLYTRETEQIPFQFNSKETTFENAPFKKDKTLIVLMHGYRGNKDSPPNPQLRQAYFSQGDYNIISVDYPALVKEGCYIMAAYNVDNIGKCIAKCLFDLLTASKNDLSVEKTHIIGFSLGAQISGAIGKYFHEFSQVLLPRITALDPALPFFDSYLTPNQFRIDQTDAEFVQVIHTNVQNKGVLQPAGDVDFYINKGTDQPGCLGDASCDHVRAVDIYAESIDSPKGFWGIRCVPNNYNIVSLNEMACDALPDDGTELVLMGEYIDKTVNGTYLVFTNAKSPFARGKERAGVTDKSVYLLLL